jgi:amidase
MLSPILFSTVNTIVKDDSEERALIMGASGEPPVAQLKDWYEQGDVPANSTADFWDLCAQRDEYRAQYAKYWASTGDLSRTGRVPDGIILPVAPTTAVRSGDFQYYGYSAIANVLDLPSGAIPVTFGHQELDDVKATTEAASSDLDAKVRGTCE